MDEVILFSKSLITNKFLKNFVIILLLWMLSKLNKKGISDLT